MSLLSLLATLLPAAHNLFLASATALYRRPPPDAVSRTRATRRTFRYQMLGTGSALAFTVLMNTACVAVAYATSLQVSPADRTSLADSPLLNAPRMLSNTLGRYAGLLFAVSLIASGQSATMTGTLAGQFVMEGFLEIKIGATARAIVARLVALVPAVVVALVYGDRGSEGLILLSSVVLAFQLPFALVPLIKFVSDERYVGPALVLGPWSTRLASVLALFFILSNLFLVSVLLRNGRLPDLDGSLKSTAIYGIILVLSLAYVAALLALVLRPLSGSSKEFTGRLPLRKEATPSPSEGRERSPNATGGGPSDRGRQLPLVVGSDRHRSANHLEELEADDRSDVHVAASPMVDRATLTGARGLRRPLLAAEHAH